MSADADLCSVDELAWDDDDNPSSPEDTDDYPLLLNIPLTPRDYFLRVTAATQDVSETPQVGDLYWLITALRIDDPLLAGDYNLDGLVDAADDTA